MKRQKYTDTDIVNWIEDLCQDAMKDRGKRGILCSPIGVLTLAERGGSKTFRRAASKTMSAVRFLEMRQANRKGAQGGRKNEVG